MKTHSTLLIAIALVLTASQENTVAARETIDFNFDWQFHLGKVENIANGNWQSVRLPHDWSIRESYQREDTAASTGFVPGGIGWYKKSFTLLASDRGKKIWIEFDGVYCKSKVWINGQKLGFRPNGYSSFSYDLTEHLHFGDQPNLITVKVDHTAYVDARWYTGSGIYRNVRLVTAAPVHIPQWGVQVTTPRVDTTSADVHVKTTVVRSDDEDVEVELTIIDTNGNVIAERTAQEDKQGFESTLKVHNPALWGVDSPNLYTVRTAVKHHDAVVDEVETTIGIRTFEFDAQKGFSLNGESMKLKGVNLHHDAGAVGAAVPKAIWESRVKKLKSIGVNAIRMSHNPHSVELMDVCDEMGMLVMDEFFDEWDRPKEKNLGDGYEKAKNTDATRGYTEYFHEWAERDLKDLIRRDFNHPSVIFWSIGNEIEWTFPKYTEAFNILNPDTQHYEDAPEFDPQKVKPVFDELTGGDDPLAKIAKRLSKWVKEMDTTRPVVCGSVRPSIAAISGYADAVDVLGFNYRAPCYDVAHETYPDLKILGSENWGAYSEWKNVKDRDFVSGMFAWTGFAYLGEAGPWPRKGLNISFFDFAGFKTPRGHFFECLWIDSPKVYMVTTPAQGSEYSYSASEGWKFEMQMPPPPAWGPLRRWEWYRVNEHWNYEEGEEVIVQVYSNCEEVELFLNDKSLGKQLLADFSEDNIVKWLVQFQQGDLRAIGYRDGQVVDEYSLTTTGELAQIELSADKNILKADGYDVAFVYAQLLDASGVPIRNKATPITFEGNGQATLLAVDNGWEKNVDSHYQPTVKTYNGRAVALVQSNGQQGTIEVSATVGNRLTHTLKLKAD